MTAQVKTGLIVKQDFFVVELFAGAGGLALGLEKAGFKTLATVENNKWACETLRKNRPNWNILEEDVIKIAESFSIVFGPTSTSTIKTDGRKFLNETAFASMRLKNMREKRCVLPTIFWLLCQLFLLSLKKQPTNGSYSRDRERS